MTTAVLTLAVEVANPTSGPDASQVALGRIGSGACEVLGAEPVLPGSRERDDLLPACQRLMRAHSSEPADLGLIAVDVGPGGFTGLRVAVAAAATLAHALGVRVVPVQSPSVAAIAGAAQSGAFMVALASKRDSAWAEVFEDGGKSTEPGRVLTPDELSQLKVPAGDRGFRLISDEYLPAAWSAIAAERGWLVEPIRFSGPALLHAAARLPAQAAVLPEVLRPVYGREPEAVTLWRARHG